jgi:aryl-alcohol dehydrogenase-like predicted oxidoreductase
MNNNFTLGTAQFGLPYGIANQAGQVSGIGVAEILGYAWAAGVATLDTAIDYGDSEVVLGKVGVEQWQVISKLPEIPETCTDIASWVHSLVADSLERLKISRFRAILLHRPEQLLGSQGDELYRALVATRDQGKAEKIGVSIYSPDELEALWSRYKFDLVQAPFNILDRRLVASGWMARLHQAGTEVHIRSVFLQGLLLMDAVSRPEKFNRWQPLWDQWHRWLNDQGVTALQSCLAVALAQPEIDQVVVGVDSLKQLEEILACVKTSAAIPPETLISEDLDLINPSHWNTF